MCFPLKIAKKRPLFWHNNMEELLELFCGWLSPSSFHGAVLRSTYVDCQYSTVRICAYVVPVTMLKFLLSSRICGSSCCSLLKYSLS